MKFSEEALEFWKKAGWYEGRKIPEKDLELFYDDYPKKAIEFLREFGKLAGKCKEQTYTEVVNEFSTFPKAIESMFIGDKEYSYYQKILERKLFPIGLYATSASYICCDEDCRVYLIGEYCVFWGNNLYEAFEKIILQTGWNTLQLDDETGKWWNDDAKYVELPPLE